MRQHDEAHTRAGFYFLHCLFLLIAPACGQQPLVEEGETTTPANVSYSIALDSSQDLPACTDLNAHQLVWVKSEKLFYSCEKLGWTEIEMAGEIAHSQGETREIAQAKQGGETTEKTEKKNERITSIAEPKGQNCSAGGTRIDFGKEISYICNGVDGSDGVNGENGIKGEQGIAGTDGTNGTNGINGESTKVYDANDNHIGYLVDYSEYMVMLKDGNMVQLMFGTGKMNGAKAYVNNNVTNAQCFYESSDCSGTCYLSNSSNNIQSPMKNWLIEGNNVVYKLDGTETALGGSKTMNSRIVQGSCSTGTWTNTSNIPVTSVWENSNSLTIPANGPLYFVY